MLYIIVIAAIIYVSKYFPLIKNKAPDLCALPQNTRIVAFRFWFCIKKFNVLRTSE